MGECEIIETSVGNNGSNEDKTDGCDDNQFTPSDDIQNLVKDGNKHGYFVATQDKMLSDTLRSMVYVPQMWLTRGVLIFDSPSAASRKFSQREEREKQKTGGGTMTTEESNLIRRLREERLMKKRKENADKCGNERKKRKAKGPNPLSCKKKKR